MQKESLMVNNSTNINKTNNHLSPQIIEHMVFEILILAWHKHKNVATTSHLKS
jgi:hypothetical protein